MRDVVLNEVIYHAMVAKDAKVDTRNGMRCGLCVRGFITPRPPTAQRLRTQKEYVAVLADSA